VWQEINYTEDPIDLLVPNITYKINPAEIESIESNSIAEEIGFESGDSIISINGKKPRDLIDYQILISEEILDILLEVVFDKKGQIQIEKVESLLNILFRDSENINSDLIPVANAGLKLFVSKKGSEVRKNLLLSLIKDEKLEFTDAKKLLALIRDTFNPLNIAKSAVQNIISTV